MNAIKQFYIKVLVPLSVVLFILTLFLALPLTAVYQERLDSEKQDEKILKLCQPANQGDTFTVDSQKITIGIVHYSSTTRVGGKGWQVNSQWSEVSLYINGAPVSEYHGWKIARLTSSDKYFLCSPEAIETIINK